MYQGPTDRVDSLADGSLASAYRSGLLMCVSATDEYVNHNNRRSEGLRNPGIGRG